MLARFFTASAAAVYAALLCAAPGQAFTHGPSCGKRIERGDNGTAIRVLFAKNGAVQRYEIVGTSENTEAVNDFRVSLERLYGPAGMDAPPVRIVSFKAGKSGGMMLPDKAIDSCGRTFSFF
ncbi:MAG TPA: hypothetical protein VGN11_06405 [Candidatus Baltobacteraceae bacterium]|jgi:hypothetical protein|nr:hypothetical protein [Candidatus Baltobacteraceae bacterium]